MAPSNLSTQAQHMLAFARKEADRLNHNFVGTEHLLLGLMRLGQGIAFRVLRRLSIDPDVVRREIEKQVLTGPEQKVVGNIPYTPRVKKVLALSSTEATNMKHSYVGTEHIVLGLLREGDGIAARVLKTLGVEIERVREQILQNPDTEDPGTTSQTPSEQSSTTKHGASLIPGEGSFTPRAQQVLALARKEADQFNHSFIGPEHLLLGLIRLGAGVAVNVLLKLGLDLETVRVEVEKQIGRGQQPETPFALPYTPRLGRVLRVAQKEAKTFHHTYVGTEHLLLGLLQEDGGVCARVFKNLKVDVEKTRTEIVRELDPNAT